MHASATVPAVRPRFVLVELPRHQNPRKYLKGLVYNAMESPDLVEAQELVTTNLSRARIWTERTGPYQFLRRHPELGGIARRFYVLPLPPVPASH